MTKKILVIEDERNIAQLLEIFLTGEGYQVSVALDGLEGVKLTKQSKPDLVILDIQLPHLDGWGALELLKTSSDTRNIPVLMCTRKNLIGDVDRAMSGGAVGYITKPFELERVLKKITQIIGIP